MSARILAIDPGSRNMGWAVLDSEGKLIDWGTIKTKPKTPQPETLLILLQALEDLVAKFHPSRLALEDLFFSRNVRSAMRVGEARGMVLLICAQHDLPHESFTPQKIKMVLTGSGKADKDQIADAVEKHLGIRPPSQHAGDAACAALCMLELEKEQSAAA
jgi:crossover junction endodeoxyribonuclease RuvC